MYQAVERLLMHCLSELVALRPEWNEKRVSDNGIELTDKEKREILPLEHTQNDNDSK